MAPTAIGKQPEYDLTLSDVPQGGASPTIGLMAVSPGSIRRLPRGPGVERKSVEQKDWSGGRGNERFSADTSRFADSNSLWSLTPGQILPGPLMRFTQPDYRDMYRVWPNDLDANGTAITNYHWHSLISTGSGTFAAMKFVATAFVTTFRQCMLIVRRVGTPANSLIVSLRSDSAGSPGAIIASAALVGTGDITDTLARIYEFTWAATQTLTPGTTYWLSVGDNGGGGTNASHWEVLLGVTTSAVVELKKSADGSSWANYGGSGNQEKLFFRVYEEINALGQRQAFFFEYKSALMMATFAQGFPATAKVYLNGDRGVCTGAQTTAKIVDTTKLWQVNEWKGLVVAVTKGPNAGQSRKILSNTATDLVVQSGSSGGLWPETPTVGASGTEYVILGADSWFERATVTLNGAVTDVAVMNAIVYVAAGDANIVTRFQEINSVGVWTVQEADEGTHKTVFLETFQEGEKVYLYSAGGASLFNRAEKVAWGTNLTFGTAQVVGDASTAITAMTIYDDAVHIGKEDGLYRVENNIASEIPVPIRTARDVNNCVGMKAWNTNLYFPFLDGLERLLGRTVDDIGPNRDAGLPAERRGRIADFLPVLQYAFVALNGDVVDGHYSSILATTSPGRDWHELFRSPMKNMMIRSLFYQSIPHIPNRLWFAVGSDVAYLLLPSTAQNPHNDDQMVYSWEGALTTSWIDVDTAELDHFFDELRAFTRNLGAGFGTNAPYINELKVQWQLNNDSASWTALGNNFVTSPYQKLDLANPVSGARDVHANRIRFRYLLNNMAGLTPIVVNETELRLNQMNEVLYDVVIDVKLEDKLMLLSGGEASELATAVIAQLQAWQETGLPLTLRSRYAIFDNQLGHIDPVSLTPVSWDAEETKMSGSLTFKQT